jgi:predicted aldo/keto reductase-like oxidoreductase
MSISRRRFLEATALSGVTACLPPLAVGTPAGITKRVLGKTGVYVSILAMGGGSRYLMYKDEEQALEALEKALDLGITYIDTSDDYGDNHLSERRIGKVIKTRKQKPFVATKLSSRNGAESARIVEQSLRALQMDRVDLIHIHSLTTKDDLARIEAKGGVLEQLLKLRGQGMTRFIGITSHTDPHVLKTALERHDFDCTQMALNGALVGMKSGAGGMVPNPAMPPSFQTVALPVAVRKQMGVLAMKVFAQDALLAHATPKDLLYYSLSLPVTAAVVGMPKLEHIRENVQFATRFSPLPQSEMERISGKLAGESKAKLDLFFSNHVDAWIA